MDMDSIGFIGAGNMATSLITGLINSGYPAEKIWASSPHQEKMTQLKNVLGIHTTTNNVDVASNTKIIVLAVKPKHMQTICLELAATIHDTQPLLLSIAAGVRCQRIQQWLNNDAAIVRCMPNTPALVQCGASALYATTEVSQSQIEQAETILRAAGLTLWVEHEDQLDTVTALSGSGPAYFLLILEALAKAAEQQGLAAETANLLTIQTMLGTAKLALESTKSPKELRQQVTSPGGTTEQGVHTLEQGGLAELLQQAIEAAKKRAKQLAN